MAALTTTAPTTRIGDAAVRHTMPVAGDNGDASAGAVLSRAQADRVVIQDFTPFTDSIEWELGHRYWQQQGSRAFLSDLRPVPYAINNDGTLSASVAEVFFASLEEAAAAGPLPPQVVTLELGIGVGLFARYFLDAFQELCRRHGRDYYDRLLYVAGDNSEQMLRDAARSGVFARHPGRYLLRVVDALQPEAVLLKDRLLAGQGPRPLHAVFLNYLLDCLPIAVFEVDDDVRQLCVRTCLARGVDLREHTSLNPAQLRQRAASADPAERRELAEVFGLFASDYAYLPVAAGRVPYGEFAVDFARTNRTGRVLDNFGALQCLDRCLGLLAEGGFILLNDYGQTEVTDSDEFRHQHFSQAICIGLNFPLLKAYFEGSADGQWVEPVSENKSIYSRLLGRRLAGAAVTRFRERFSKDYLDRIHEPACQARELAKMGQFEAAAVSYCQALERQPTNWVLMNEVAVFLTFSFGNPGAAVEMTKTALSLNPTSSELWNTLGDSLYESGRVAEARQAYLRAQRLNPNDPRSRYSLAWVYTREKNYPLALQKIAEALGHDFKGEYRERLLKKQQEILDRQTQRNLQEYQRVINRINTATAAGPDRSCDSPVQQTYVKTT
jgi:tetratricopeptide (TPR) repeat protein